MATTTPMLAHLIMGVSDANAAAGEIYEITPTGVGVRTLDGSVLYETNHFVGATMAGTDNQPPPQHSTLRYERLGQLVPRGGSATMYGDLEASSIVKILRDRLNPLTNLTSPPIFDDDLSLGDRRRALRGDLRRRAPAVLGRGRRDPDPGADVRRVLAEAPARRRERRARDATDSLIGTRASERASAPPSPAPPSLGRLRRVIPAPREPDLRVHHHGHRNLLEHRAEAPLVQERLDERPAREHLHQVRRDPPPRRTPPRSASVFSARFPASAP